MDQARNASLVTTIVTPSKTLLPTYKVTCRTSCYDFILELLINKRMTLTSEGRADGLHSNVSAQITSIYFFLNFCDEKATVLRRLALIAYAIGNQMPLFESVHTISTFMRCSDEMRACIVCCSAAFARPESKYIELR